MSNREKILEGLVKEILDWTHYKNTDWAIRAKEALQKEKITDKGGIWYKVTYSRRHLFKDIRCIYTDVEMSEKDFKDIVANGGESQFGYIVISCEMINPDFKKLSTEPK